MALAPRSTRHKRGVGVVRSALERYRLLADNRRVHARQAAKSLVSQHDASLASSLDTQHAPHAGSLVSERILDAAPEGIIGLDPEGRITFANPAAARMTGYTVEELQGQPIRTHMQFAGSSPAVPDLPRGQESCWREDGTSFPIECQSASMSVDGRIVGAVVTFRDISKHKAVEQMKDELISVVSHELRTPLTSIRSALGLLVSGVVGTVPEKGQRMLQIAVKNTDRLIRLINDTLDLERVNSGDFRMERVVCDAADLMAQAADGVRAMAEQACVVLHVAPREVRLIGDPDRLLQVLTNLLSNAIKFSPAGGGMVWLEAEESGSELLFRVRDEGRGIPADKLESIFDRFGQVDVSDSREKGGTGLGLAICRSIVKQHNGQIWAESTLGAGTTVCVALPSCATEIPRSLGVAA